MIAMKMLFIDTLALVCVLALALYSAHTNCKGISLQSYVGP